MPAPAPRDAETWTVSPMPGWFTRCDRCGRWRVFAHYHEFHTGLGSESPSFGSWWRECMDCSFATVSAWGREFHEAFMASLAEELEAR